MKFIWAEFKLTATCFTAIPHVVVFAVILSAYRRAIYSITSQSNVFNKKGIHFVF